MGTFAFLNFLIIFSLILNAFSDANRHRCGCGCRHKRCCDDSSSSEERCGCAGLIACYAGICFFKVVEKLHSYLVLN